MVEGNDSNEALKRVGDTNVPARVSYYEKTTVTIVKDEYAQALEKELQR